MKRTFIKNTKKRPRESDSDSDSTDSINSNKKILTFNEHKSKYDSVMKEISERNITMNDVFKLNLPMDEYVWFMEHLKISNKLEEYSEDKLRVKNMIYQKYINLKNVNIGMLNKIKIDSKVDDDIVLRILSSDHPDTVKAILYKKYKRCFDNAGSNGMSDEFFKMIEWVDNVLNLPTKINHTDKNDIHDKLIKLWRSLNNNISGLQHVKEKVMESMCSILLNPENKGKIIIFVGPPGVGKTAIALSISEALGKPFDQISFGSVKDSSVLTGHSSTYIGAVPGLFTKILLKSSRLDTVVLLDELDKIPDTSEGKSISSVLLHILDRTQNHRFRDMYMTEIIIDLSKMIFFAAANDLKNVDPVLLDRMAIIELNGYDLLEKTNIAIKHMFPRIRKELGFSETDLILDEQQMKYLIKNKTENQLGMREVERKIYQLCERLSLLKYAKEIPFSYKMTCVKFPHRIDENTINNLL
jgi:ATP-dependent Lon protease